MALSIERREEDGAIALVLRGDLDLATSPQLRDELVDVIGDGTTIVVDLEGVDFLDSVGLGILVSGLKRARAHGGELELVASGRAVLKTFEITGLDKTFTFRG